MPKFAIPNNEGERAYDISALKASIISNEVSLFELLRSAPTGDYWAHVQGARLFHALSGELGVLENGGVVTGVVPRQLAYQDLAHEGLSRLHVVDTMHERKHKMQSLAHASLALPGGFGTIEEIFEALAWAQQPLELHEKQCVFLNIDGYYDQKGRQPVGSQGSNLISEAWHED